MSHNPIPSTLAQALSTTSRDINYKYSLLPIHQIHPPPFPKIPRIHHTHPTPQINSVTPVRDHLSVDGRALHVPRPACERVGDDGVEAVVVGEGEVWVCEEECVLAGVEG